MADTFKIGDVVKLKAGGVPMTVIDVFKNETGVEACTCAFFSENNLEKYCFPTELLIAV